MQVDSRPRYHDIESMRRLHPAWRLLRADHAALIIDFLCRVFVAPNRRIIGHHELIDKLEDFLYYLRESAEAEAFPQSALAYVETWSSDQNAWLRKYYVNETDEPQYDLTPMTERAIEWVMSLEERQFVGTESRLMTVFDLLRQIVEGTQADPQRRTADLERRRALLDEEIERARHGDFSILEAAQVKDRFRQLESTALRLLADFRQVEQNFRTVDRSARERIARWEGTKGALLAEIFEDCDVISHSDEGKSFQAFWDFLVSPSRQDELSALLREVFALDEVRAIEPDRRLLRIHFDWLKAGESAQRTVARLSGQLRRLVDDRVVLENRRIAQLIREIEGQAIDVRDHAPAILAFLELDDTVATINVPMDRPLYTPPLTSKLLDHLVTDGVASTVPDALFDQFFVDKPARAAFIRRALADREAISLGELILQHPLEHGLAEIIVYFTLGAERAGTTIDDMKTERFEWQDADNVLRCATAPLVTYRRSAIPSGQMQ